MEEQEQCTQRECWLRLGQACVVGLDMRLLSHIILKHSGNDEKHDGWSTFIIPDMGWGTLLYSAGMSVGNFFFFNKQNNGR